MDDEKLRCTAVVFIYTVKRVLVTTSIEQQLVLNFISFHSAIHIN